MPEFCRAERDGRVMTITITRPEVMNALHAPASNELGELLDEFAADPELWVAIYTGEGDRAFCAGNDLKATAKLQAEGSGQSMAIPPSGFGGMTSRWDLEKPVIAAVNGVCMGGGFEIALACDLIIASDNARFALPEPKVGLAALAGGMQRLPRQIGLKPAMGMLLTGRHVPAAEGRELGFVNEVVPQAELMATARRWADQIAECSPLSVRATKDVAMRSLEISSLRESIETKYDSIHRLMKSEDFVEGPRAFAEKRTPSWKGR